MSKPKVNGSTSCLSCIASSAIVRCVVAIRGESRCYNKDGSKDLFRIQARGGNALGLFIPPYYADELGAACDGSRNAPAIVRFGSRC